MKIDKDFEEQFIELTNKVDSISNQFIDIKKNPYKISSLKMMYFLELQNILINEVYSMVKKLVKNFTFAQLSEIENMDTIGNYNSSALNTNDDISNLHLMNQSSATVDNINFKYKSRSVGHLTEEEQMNQTYSFRARPTMYTKVLLNKSYSILDRYNRKSKGVMHYRQKIRKNKNLLHISI